MMRRILLLEPVLRAISDGNLIKLVFIWVLRVNAGLAVLGVLFASYQLWSSIGRNLGIGTFLMILLMQIALLLLVFVIFNILMIRAEDIKGLPVASGYPVVPIFVILYKSFGEITFFTYSILGIAGGLVVMFSGGRIPIPIPLPFIDQIGGGFGIGLMITGILVGFLFLVVTYAVAELIQAPVETAMNSRRRG